jgi:hypothetical protein
LDDFDLGDTLTRRRTVTQVIARWAYGQGHHGIAYKSRLDAAFDCWAIFEGTRFEILGITTIARHDVDLVTIAATHGLML